MGDTIDHNFNNFGVGALVATAILGLVGKMWSYRFDRKLERLKDEINRKQFVHQLQFQTEFKSYLGIWKRAIEVRQAALSIQGLHEPIVAGSEKDDRIKLLATAFDQFTDFYAQRQPFVSNPVFGAANALNDSVFKKWLSVTRRSPSPHEPEYWSEARQQAEAIQEKVERLCDAIRHRIWAEDGEAPERKAVAMASRAPGS